MCIRDSRVIAHKRQNRKEQIPAYQYEKYEKVQFALSNITEKFKNRKYLKNFQFIFNNLDSCLLYTSDAADERSSVDLGGRRIIKKKKKKTTR